MASICQNFRKKQQPTQILELNAGYGFDMSEFPQETTTHTDSWTERWILLSAAADKVRIWNEVHHQGPWQSVSVQTEQTSLLQQPIKPDGEK